MAGTLFGLGLSQQFDVNGDPMAGAQLFIYLANSSTPVNVYKDFTLTLLHPYPILTDSTGRIPAFWLPDGFYRARLIDAGGMPQFDEAYMAAMGPSTGVAATTGTDPDGTFTTGDVKWRPTNANLPSGWVRINGQTFGSSTSGADVVAAGIINQALFLHIWNNYSNPSANVICPVVGGLGGSGLLDWNANKKITLLDMRGRGPFGFSDMGNVNLPTLFNNVPFTQGSSIISGAQGGAQAQSLVRGNLPQVDLFNTGDGVGNVPTATFSPGGSFDAIVARNPGGGQSITLTSGGTNIYNPSTNYSISLGGHLYLNGNVTPAPLNNVPLFSLGTWYWRL